jgi:heme-degrading monooxygenase HmoA
MYTRIVEVTAKTGKSRDLANTIHEKVLPILKRQPGFVDETVLLSDTEPDHVVALSSWNKQEDAERYHNKDFKIVRETIESLMACEPMVRTFNLHSSTTHKIAAGKAA